MRKTVRALLCSVLLFSGCTPAIADTSKYEFEFDFTALALEHAWRDPLERDPTFREDIYGLGLTTWRGNWGLRMAYYKGEQLTTSGYYDFLVINMGHIIAFEALYKWDINEHWRVLAGLGTYQIPYPQYYEGIDPDSHAANDADNDEGYTYGIQYRFNEKLSIGWRFTHYSRIKVDPYDEWTKGHSLNITYHF